MANNDNQLARQVSSWDLQIATGKPATESILIGPQADNGIDTVLDVDRRIMVDPMDVTKGGKYYSVLKLQIRFEGQDSADSRWAQGTGWLIQPDLLVTAGHCAFDHTYSLGRASQIKAFAGYKGKNSVGSPDVQFRSGLRALVPQGWMKSESNRQNDVAFVKLDKPFDDVRPYEFQPTPTQGSDTIGVVGYPMDKSFAGEAGSHMYEAFRRTDFDLSSTMLNMLEHKISAFAGQFGSPVIIQGSSTVIGTHVYCSGSCNSASVIRGDFGNFYSDYQTAINGSSSGDDVPNKPAAQVAPSKYHEEAPVSDTESFWDALKKVAGIGARVSPEALTTGSPFLGPVGGPITAVAGTALGVMGKAWSQEPFVQPSSVQYKEFASRAIMAEAALQALFGLQSALAQKMGIFKRLEEAHRSFQPSVGKIATTLGPLLMESALRLAVVSASSVEATYSADETYPTLPRDRTVESDETRDDVRLANELSRHASRSSEDRGYDEKFIDFLDGLLRATRNATSPEGHSLGTRLDEAAGSSAKPAFAAALEAHFKAIFQRALFGDAALQVIESLPSDVREKEGIFDSMLETVKAIGSKVIEVAPVVLRSLDSVGGPGTSISKPESAPSVPPGPVPRGPRQKFAIDPLQQDTGLYVPGP